MNLRKTRLFAIAIFGTLLISFALVQKNKTSFGCLTIKKDSIAADSLQILVNEYCQLNKTIDSISNLIKFEKQSDSAVSMRIDELNTILKNVNSLKSDSIKALKNDSLIKTLLAQNDSIKEISVQKINALKKLIHGEEIEKLVTERELKYSGLKLIIKNLKTFSGKTIGSKELIFYGVKYHLFVSDLDSDKVRLHLLHPKQASSLGNVKAYLELQKIKPLMITNAGMYTSTYEPEGLYIEENPLKKYGLDMGNSMLGLNFYLKPNGVFYLDTKNRPHIDTTQEFARLQRLGRIKVKLATQSGPMLVINGRIHPAFVKGSNNRKIRSGVGIINSKKIVFAATLDGSNFYDFAVFLKDVFNCKNALFLDGAISRMYLHDIDSTETGGEFGPVISVSRKNKK